MTMSEMLLRGSPVLWLIVAMGVVGICVFLERSLHLHRARIKADDFLDGVRNILKKDNTHEALAICDDTAGPVAYLVKTAIENRSRGHVAMERAVKDAADAETSRLERRLVILATIAQLAPVLGLLGTVMGMIDMAMVMKHGGPLVSGVDLADGLLGALSTTAAGLAVMIPAVAAFNMLVVKIDRLVLDMERAGREMVTFLLTMGKGGIALAADGEVTP